MSDERIQTTVNRFAAMGFSIWQLLLSISLCYRMLILKQHPREFWDIFAIFFIGTLYVSIAFANKGVFGHGITRRSLTIAIPVGIIIAAAIIGFSAWKFSTPGMDSVVAVLTLLIGTLLVMGLVFGIAHFLKRRWERKEGIEDEK